MAFFNALIHRSFFHTLRQLCFHMLFCDAGRRNAEVLAELDAFEQGPWGQKYPAVTDSWRRRWEEVIPFFAFTSEVRRIIYTTNAIESLHSQVREAIRNKGHFPSDEAASKMIYLALRNIAAKWKRPPKEWHAAKAQLAIQFGH